MLNNVAKQYLPTEVESVFALLRVGYRIFSITWISGP